MAGENAMTVRECEVWEEGNSEKKGENMKRQACGTKKNPPTFAPGSSIA